MDASRVIESLESLWFFTSIFTPRNQSLGSASDEITAGNHVKESPKEELSEPISPILQNKLNDQLSSAEVLVPMCPKCEEFAAEIEPQIVEPVEMELLESQRSTEKQERRRIRRRRKRSLNRRRKILRELDLDVDVKEVSGSWMFEETYGYRRFGDQNQNELPSFNDNLAMKEHLKSWAYAVACTVR